MSDQEITNPFFYETSYQDVQNSLAQLGISSDASHYLYRQLFQKGPSILHHDKHIAERTIAALSQSYSLDLPQIDTIQRAQDGTCKFLLRLSDGEKVEAVLLPYHKRFTICLSSQVGCKMGCTFCFTATGGFTRNLKAYEIIGQYLVLTWWAKENCGERGGVKPNLVFMGQGEPLDNFEALKKSIEIMLQSTGIHLGPRQMTLSSCGHLPGMEKFPLLPPINFALSLHSPFDEIRQKLIPINKIYPLDKVFSLLESYPLAHRQFITFEYMLVKDLTNRPIDADALACRLKPFKALVSLIPFNPFPGSLWQRPSEEEVEKFKALLVQKNVRVMVRTTKGDEILAACGQLRGK